MKFEDVKRLEHTIAHFEYCYSRYPRDFQIENAIQGRVLYYINTGAEADEIIKDIKKTWMVRQTQVQELKEKLRKTEISIPAKTEPKLNFLQSLFRNLKGE
jgi:uncharacterized membrane protein